MQQEDDLRGLAKVMDFMRAVSILFVVMNIYWFCYEAFKEWGVTIGVMDKILMNFQRTAGLFSSIIWTKLFCVVLLALSCLGTHGIREEKITWAKINTYLGFGFIFFFLNWWLLALPLPMIANTALYIFAMTVGYVCLLMAGLYMSRLLKNNLMDDVFNTENESFMQETRLMENEYSVNLPTKFQYKGKQHNGWINIVNPFRATIVLATPGSGKSYAVVNNYIKQQIEKGFAMYIYDFKYPDLSTIAYNHMKTHRHCYTVKPKFYVINFDNPRSSHRCNPINPTFMTDISDAYESAYTIMLNLNRTWIQKQGDFFVESPIILLAAIIWYLKIYQDGKYCTFPHTKKHRLFCKRTGIEPTIGHLKSDYRLGRNFYKGLFGDVINVMLAAVAYNFKRAMKVLWCLINKISETLREEKVSLKCAFEGTTNTIVS